jgi:TP901 family phage tail tape measure protein
MDKVQVNIQTMLSKPSDADIQKVKKDIEKQFNTININTSSRKGIQLLNPKEISDYQKHMENMMRNLKTRYGKLLDSTDIKRQVDEFNKSLSGFGRNGLSKKDIGLQFETLTTNVKSASGALRLATQDADTLGNVLKKDFQKFGLWFGIGTIFMSGVHAIKSMISTIYDLDTAMISLKKVTNETDVTYKSFLKTSNDTARSLAVATTQVIDSTTAWVKAGYSLSQAQELAKSTLIGSNVGDISVQDMQSYLVAPLKAYNMEAEKSIDIVSKMNNVSNKHAITIQDLGQAYNRGSSMMAMANNTLDEFTALVTAAQAQTQMGGDVIGNAFRTIALRLTSMKDDETGEVIPKLGEDLDKVGVSLKNVDGSLMSTYGIIKQLNDVWKSGILTQEEQLNLLEKMAGKRQANILAAAIDNFAEAEKTLNDSINAGNSALEEQAKYLQSIQAKSKQFKEATVGMWNNFISSDTIKYAVDFGTVLIDLTDQFGVLNTVLAGTIVYLGLSGKLLAWIPAMKNVTAATHTWAASMGMSEKAAVGLGKATTALYPLLALVALWGVVKVFDAITVTIEEQTEKVKNLSNELKNLQTTYDQLLAKENRTEQEEKYLAILEKQIAAQETQLKNNAKLLVRRQYGENADSASLGGATGIGNITESIYGVGKSGRITRDITELERYNKELLKLDENNIKSGKTYEDLQNKIAQKTDSLAKEYQEIQNNIKILEEANEQGSEEYKILVDTAKIIEEVISKQNALTNSTNKATNAFNGETKSVEDFVKLITDSQTKLSSLNDALKEYRENGKLSSETLNSLIKQYPQLMQYLGNEQRLRQELVNIIESESNIQAQNYVNMLQNSEDFYNRVLEGQNLLADGLNKAYGIDLKNYKSLAEAKFDIEKKLLSGFGDMWRDYYDAQSGQMTANISELSRLASMNDPQAKALLERIRLASQTTNKLNDFTLGLAKTDLAKININKDKDGKEKTLSDYLPREQELLNYISNAENKIKDLTQEEYQARLDGIKPIEDANNALISYYKNVRATLTDKEMIADINSKIIKLEGDNASLAKERKDIEDDIVKAKEKQAEADQKNLEDIQKQIVEVIKKRYEIEKDEAEKAHKEKIEQLDDELDAYKENVDAQIKEIDRLRDKEDFDKSQQKTTDKITELTNERNTLSLAAQSGDLTAIERIKEIDKDLAEQRENLSELQQDREYDLRKQNLQDMLDEKEEKIKNAKEAAEREWEIEKAKYEQLLTEQSLFNEANKVLMKSSVADITKMFEDLGLVIERDLLSKLKEVLELMNTVGKSNIKVNTNGTISLPQYASGGVNDFTGLAMLHGSPSAVETVLNATQGKKLYEFINKLPMMPNLNMSMPKISTVGGNGYGDINLGGIAIYTQTVDQNSVGNIVNQVATKFKQELNKSGIFRK